MITIPTMVIETIKANAALGVYRCNFDDVNQRAYLEFCTTLHWQTGACILFCREEDGDYGKHLLISVSFREPKPAVPADSTANPYVLTRLGNKVQVAPFDQAQADAWLIALLGKDHPRAWMRKPLTPDGEQLQIQHWMVMCDGEWNNMPRLLDSVERQLRSIGWASWDDVHRPAAG